MQKFQQMISSIAFDDIYQSRDVSECYELFEANLITCYNACFPLVILSRKCARDKKWVTRGIKLCSRKKNKLHKQWLLTGKGSDGIKYKNYRKVYIRVLADAENSYYREHFCTKINYIKQLWLNLNRIFSLSKAKSNTSISKLMVHNVEVTEPKDICNGLNNFFCTVGKI